MEEEGGVELVKSGFDDITDRWYVKVIMGGVIGYIPRGVKVRGNPFEY